MPGAQIFDAITKGVVKPPNVGTSTVAPTPTDALHNLEQTSTLIVSSVMAAQSSSPSVGLGGSMPLTLLLPSSQTVKVNITLPARNVTLSELQRLKRQFVTAHKKVITLGAAEKGAVEWGPEQVAEKFISYLEEHLKP